MTSSTRSRTPRGARSWSTLKGRERAASELADPFGMTFAAISQHLRVLEEAELVVGAARGPPAPLPAATRSRSRRSSSWIDEFAAFFGQRLDALGDYLDRKHGKRR